MKNRYVSSVTLRTGIGSLSAGANSKQTASSIVFVCGTRPRKEPDYARLVATNASLL